ncbi:MAG: imidazoleglycerol-phosphate dehydratase HisB, partial [Ignavibacteriaceae bacterium]
EINPSVEVPSAKVFYITAAKETKADKNIVIVPSENINNFEQAVTEIINRLRYSSQHRKTKETDINIEISLDGRGQAQVNSGIGFFDHMLEQIARHANINLKIDVAGDLHIDEHHTVEDVGITLGTAINEALGDKMGIKRYGFSLPMDDAIAHCAIDLGGRGFLNFKCKFEREKVGEFPTELTEEFFRGLASGLKANIFIRAKAKNDHHKIESIFKAFAKSLNEACRLDERNEGGLPSTKGIL